MDKDVGENADRGKQEDKKEIYHLVLVLERLFYQDFEVTAKKTTNIFFKSKGSKEEL
jgi:hypothetical protein